MWYGLGIGLIRPVRAVLAVVMALGGGSAAMAQSAQQFDVVCEIQETTTLREFRQTTSGQYRFVVDLARQRFCYNECGTVETFRTAPTTSQLDFSSGGHSIVLDRQTGMMARRREGDGGIVVTGTGQCHRAPFSGIPETTF